MLKRICFKLVLVVVLMSMFIPVSVLAEEHEQPENCRIFQDLIHTRDLLMTVSSSDKNYQQLVDVFYSDNFQGTIKALTYYEEMSPLPKKVKVDQFDYIVRLLRESATKYDSIKDKADRAYLVKKHIDPDFQRVHDLSVLLLDNAALACLDADGSLQNAKRVKKDMYLLGSHSDDPEKAEMIRRITFIRAKEEKDCVKMGEYLMIEYADTRLSDQPRFENVVVPACEELINGRISEDTESLKRDLERISSRFQKLHMRRAKTLGYTDKYKALYAASTEAEVNSFESIRGGRIKPEYIIIDYNGEDYQLANAMWAYDRYNKLLNLKSQYYKDKTIADGLLNILHTYDMDWALAETYVVGLYYQDKNHYSSLRDLLYGLNVNKRIKEQYKSIDFEVSGLFGKTYTIIFNSGGSREVRYSFVKKYFDPRDKTIHEDKIAGAMECLVLERIENKAKGLNEAADSLLAAQATVYQRFYSVAAQTEKPFLGMGPGLEIPAEFKPVF